MKTSQEIIEKVENLLHQGNVKELMKLVENGLDPNIQCRTIRLFDITSPVPIKSEFMTPLEWLYTPWSDYNLYDLYDDHSAEWISLQDTLLRHGATITPYIISTGFVDWCYHEQPNNEMSEAPEAQDLEKQVTTHGLNLNDVLVSQLLANNQISNIKEFQSYIIYLLSEFRPEDRVNMFLIFHHRIIANYFKTLSDQVIIYDNLKAENLGFFLPPAIATLILEFGFPLVSLQQIQPLYKRVMENVLKTAFTITSNPEQRINTTFKFEELAGTPVVLGVKHSNKEDNAQDDVAENDPEVEDSDAAVEAEVDDALWLFKQYSSKMQQLDTLEQILNPKFPQQKPF